jgi:hypothetical protein
MRVVDLDRDVEVVNRWALELPAGQAAQTGVQVHDRLALSQ